MNLSSQTEKLDKIFTLGIEFLRNCKWQRQFFIGIIMGNREIHQSRNFPLESGKSRAVHNPPDTPPIETTDLPGLRRILPASARIQKSNLFLTSITTIDEARGEVKGISLTPIATVPLNVHRVIGDGGGRAILGGTSKEALRRAKRKAKSNVNGKNALP